MTTAHYRASEHLILTFGLRHLRVDYRSGGTRVDLHAGGALLGATWHW